MADATSKPASSSSSQAKLARFPSVSSGKVNGVGEDAGEDAMDTGHKTSEQWTLEVAKTALAFLVFFFSGPSLIMVNRTILRELNFPFPLTLSLYTLCFASIFAFVLVHVLQLELRHASLVTPQFYIKRILPIGALTGSTIVMGMSSYLFLTVAFVQMLKAFTPVMILTLTILFGMDNPSKKIMISVIVLSTGTFISGYGEINFNILGVFCMLFAQLCEALRLVYTQKVLQNLRFDVIETLYYVTPASAGCVFLAASVMEFPFMEAGEIRDTIFTNRKVFATAGILAVSTNLVNWFVIQRASALMLKLVATARNVLLVLFNAAVMNEVVTLPQSFGYAIQLGGFIAYNYVKIQEKEKKKRTGGETIQPNR